MPYSVKRFAPLLGGSLDSMEDAIRKLHPGEKIYTFWDYFRNAYAGDAGLRIDHFLFSPHLDRRLKSAGVDRHVRSWEKTSDNAPVWIELKNK